MRKARAFGVRNCDSLLGCWYDRADQDWGVVLLVSRHAPALTVASFDNVQRVDMPAQVAQGQCSDIRVTCQRHRGERRGVHPQTERSSMLFPFRILFLF